MCNVLYFRNQRIRVANDKLMFWFPLIPVFAWQFVFVFDEVDFSLIADVIEMVKNNIPGLMK